MGAQIWMWTALYRTKIETEDTSEGAISALQGTPFELIKFRIIVTHIYRSNTSV